MKHKTSQALFAYWNEIRGMRVAPRRFEIEPSRISAILPDTFILDCETSEPFRFRLAGTRMSAILGRDVRDSGFLDLFTPQDQPTLRHVLGQTIAQAPVTVLTVGNAGTSGQEIEITLLPLLHTQNAVTRMLGSAVPLGHAHHFHGPAATPLALLDTETIWPDGRPHAVLEQLDRQSPFAARTQTGRLVAADRRRFRVFDGGKSV